MKGAAAIIERLRVWNLVHDVKRFIPILLILVLYFGARLIFFDSSYFEWDEATYVLNAFAMLGRNYYSELTLVPVARPLLLSLMLVPFLWLSKSEIVIKLYPILLNAPACLAVYMLGKKLGREVGLISALLLAIFPLHILYSRLVLTDAPMMMLATLAIFFEYTGLQEKRVLNSILGGFFLGLAVLMRFTSLFIALMSLPLFVWFHKNNLKNMTSIVAAAGLTLSPYLAWNYSMFRNPLATFFSASGVLQQSQPVSPQFISWAFIDFYGPVLIALLIIGLFLAFKGRESYFMFLSYCFFSTLLLYFLLINTGVAKPPSIEWVVERLLFPTLPFALVIVAYAIAKGCDRIHVRKLWDRRIIIGLILGAIVLSSVPSYQRTYAPAVQFENGLREATKEMGEYIRQNTPTNAILYCGWNYPVIAYYAQRRTIVFQAGTNSAWDELSAGNYLVVFSGVSPSLNDSLSHGLRVVETIGSGSWTVVLLQK